MMSAINIKNTKRIAFVVHDDKKSELIEWSYFNKDILMQHEITAPGNAGNILEGTLNKPISKLPDGEFHLLSSLITEGKIDIVIFFWNTNETQMQKNGIKALLRTALANNVIVACNKITAAFILHSSLMKREKPLETTTYSNLVEENGRLQKIKIA
ncbi:MAG TPA: methylglyoxal synthase [Panacibacter sp.]|nr:methylglyoxal synthase [Panacibacter sp.]